MYRFGRSVGWGGKMGKISIKLGNEDEEFRANGGVFLSYFFICIMERRVYSFIRFGFDEGNGMCGYDR